MHMGQKDITEKLLEEYNDVFADIVNVLLFGGKEVVLPADLSEAKIRAQYKADDAKMHEMERDVAKNWTEEGITIALYGIENQEKAEKLMPLRVFGYEGNSYKSQLLSRDTKGKKEPLYPVVTLVLHFGKAPWNQPKNLKGVISVPDVLDQYVNDFRIHVFEIAWLSDEQVSMFKSDFRVVAEFFTQMRKNEEYCPSSKELKHVDAVLKLLSVFGDVQIFEEYVKAERKKEGNNMASFVDEMIDRKAEERAQDLAKDLAQDLAQNLAQNLEKSRVAELIRKKLMKGHTVVQIAEALEESEEHILKLIQEYQLKW